MHNTRWRYIFLVFCAGFSFAAAQQHPSDDDASLRHARAILRTSPLIDGHNDLPWFIREHASPPGDVAAYDLRSRVKGQTDLPRLRAGQVGGQFWSVFIPGDLKDRHFARVQLEQIDIARQIIDRYPEALAPALSSDDAERAFRKGRIASFIGIEGGHAIENSLGALRMYYALGVRYMTLTHNSTLDWADAALDTARHNGLTPFGKEVVREMNRLGMLVDLSHVSDRVMSNALDVSEAPVIFSHSSARALSNHPRNVPDSILVRVPANGGVVMVTFVPEFVSAETAAWDETVKNEFAGIRDTRARDSLRTIYIRLHPRPKATLAQVADHIAYIRKIAGVDHVGIGGDFDGSDETPVGLSDVSCYPALFAELIRRGWPDADLKKLAGLNVLRALGDASRVARRIRAERGPSTATIEVLDRDIKERSKHTD
jgi:membrane dipeptidase